jgi:hypothetical protein
MLQKLIFFYSRFYVSKTFQILCFFIFRIIFGRTCYGTTVLVVEVDYVFICTT